MKPVIVVGGGLAGLTCARRLHERKISVCVVEADNAVGGRVRTDDVEGFKLDRGFQVLLTAYPAAQRWLDYDALDLQEFVPGAEVRTDAGWQRVADPRRRWGDVPASLRADIGSMADKLRVVCWAVEARLRSPNFPWDQRETTSETALQNRGFSDQMIERFWRPWLSGIFLESELTTSSRMLEFVFQMFARGKTAVPRRGMQAIPEQLAAGLPEGTVELNQPVAEIHADRVVLTDGTIRGASAVVLAVDATAAKRLGQAVKDVSWNEARCLYFAAEHAPTADGMLRLNGSREGVVNNLVTLSKVNPACAPAGQELIMVGIRPGISAEENHIEAVALRQLTEWFGPAVESWRLLRHDVVRKALPVRMPLRSLSLADAASGLWRCGDALRHPSIQGAMESGEQVADAIADSRLRTA